MSQSLMPSHERRALIAGGSGLVGGHCLRFLLDEDAYGLVTALVRKPLAITNPRLHQVEIDFSRLEEYASMIQADDVYCCLGTTIRRAGSREAFKRVDVDYPVDIAQIACRNGARQFLLVSSIGARPEARVFYLRMKGMVEEEVASCGFRSVQIFRPSMLLGDRDEDRPGERIGAALMTSLSFAMVGRWRPYRPIEAATVARAMVRVGRKGIVGRHVFESDEIARIGDPAATA